MLTRLVVCVLMAGGRLGELAWSRSNVAGSGATVEGAWSRRTYPLIVALHTAVIAGTFVLGGRPRWGWLALLVTVQPVRLWVLRTLGGRWNTRAAVPVEMEVATDGPYTWVRHPNYAVIAVELATLPLAFGLPGLAAIAAATNAVLLGPRIREEEAALRRLPGWEAAFARKKRFIPRVV
jgi:methyltransferase